MKRMYQQGMVKQRPSATVDSRSDNSSFIKGDAESEGWRSEGSQQWDPNDCFGFTSIPARSTSRNPVLRLLKVWVLLATEECPPPAAKVLRNTASMLAFPFSVLPLLSILYILISSLPGCSEYIRGTEMSEGEKLYRSRCSACHMLIEKDALSKEGWELAVNRYGEKLKEDDKKKILEYLTEE